MTLSRPRTTLAVDGRSFTSAEAALVRLRLSLGVDGRHDAVELLLWPSSKLAGAAPGASLAVAIGEEGSEEAVFSGEATAVSSGADAIRIEGLASTVALSRARVSQTYAQQSVAAIVTDLASAVAIDEVESDLELESYSVDDRRSVWAHIVELAALVGADVGCAASGGLRFVTPRRGSSDFTLRHGADVIAWRLGPAPKRRAAPVAAYGAGSEDGPDQWHWILRSPAPTGGSGGALRIVPALHTRDAADAVARAIADRADRAAVSGRLVVVGKPTLRPGDLVDAAGLPSGDPGTLRVVAVTHVLDAAAGLVSALTVESAGGNA